MARANTIFPRILRRFPVLGLLLLVLLLRSGPGMAETRYFPWKNLSLQDVINESASGDTVLVLPGTYELFYDNLVIVQELLELKSMEGPQKTIIRGRGKGAVIRFAAGSKAVLEGFTITSALSDRYEDLDGGGIHCTSESAPVIVNNIITGNRAVFGGGIYCDNLSTPVIDRNLFTDNQALVSGGAIFSSRSRATIRNNRFIGNHAVNSGGGVAGNRGTSRIHNNVFWKNSARFGGALAFDRSAAIIANNTIVENSADYGGGIMVDKGSVRLTNLILWHNTLGDLFLKQVGPSVRPVRSLIGDGTFRGVNGNISADPLFVDPQAGDFQLLMESPCVNSGDISPFYEDVDGSINDRGAYGGPEYLPIRQY